ncbi:MAG: hypothetical protein KF690_09080 [Bacteroidetes bacterium]|nr:hypothetical protein [Bacteroidota bacterium]
MRLSCILVLLFLSGLAGCQSSQQVARVPPDFALHMERSRCEGPCTAYSLTVDTYGQVTYEGKAYTDKYSLWRKQLDTRAMNQLTRTLRKSAFFSYDSSYNDPSVPALPWMIISYAEEGESHTVRFRVDGPETFRELYQKLERIIGDDAYEPHPTAN